MSEAEWPNRDDPTRMIIFLRRQVSRRKSQLYLCGGYRHIARLSYDPASGAAVEVAERRADGRAAWHAEAPTSGCDFEEEFRLRHASDARMRDHLREVAATLVGMGALPEAVLTGGWRVDESARDRLLAKAAERATVLGERDFTTLANAYKSRRPTSAQVPPNVESLAL